MGGDHGIGDGDAGDAPGVLGFRSLPLEPLLDLLVRQALIAHLAYRLRGDGGRGGGQGARQVVLADDAGPDLPPDHGGGRGGRADTDAGGVADVLAEVAHHGLLVRGGPGHGAQATGSRGLCGRHDGGQLLDELGNLDDGSGLLSGRGGLVVGEGHAGLLQGGAHLVEAGGSVNALGAGDEPELRLAVPVEVHVSQGAGEAVAAAGAGDVDAALVAVRDDVDRGSGRGRGVGGGRRGGGRGLSTGRGGLLGRGLGGGGLLVGGPAAREDDLVRDLRDLRVRPSLADHEAAAHERVRHAGRFRAVMLCGPEGDGLRTGVVRHRAVRADVVDERLPGDLLAVDDDRDRVTGLRVAAVHAVPAGPLHRPGDVLDGVG